MLESVSWIRVKSFTAEEVGALLLLVKGSLVIFFDSVFGIMECVFFFFFFSIIRECIENNL